MQFRCEGTPYKIRKEISGTGKPTKPYLCPTTRHHGYLSKDLLGHTGDYSVHGSGAAACARAGIGWKFLGERVLSRNAERLESVSNDFLERVVAHHRQVWN